MKAINLEVHWEDKDWTLNVQSLSTAEAMIIEMYSGTKPLALIGNLTSKPDELSTRDFQCLLWLIKRRAGVMYAVEQTPEFDVMAFMNEIMEAVVRFRAKADAEQKAETDQRAAKGLPPKKATSRTPARGSTSPTN